MRKPWPWAKIADLERERDHWKGLAEMAAQNERILSESLAAADADLSWCRRRINELEENQRGGFLD